MVKKQSLIAMLIGAAYLGLLNDTFALGNARHMLPTDASSSSEIDSTNPNDLPWFTGPIFAPAGHTVAAGHTNIEPYLFYTNVYGMYDSQSKAHHLANNVYTLSPTIVITQGVCKWMDIQGVVPYQINQTQGNTSGNVGDITFTLGFQALESIPNTWHPSLRITIGETLPTGIYENLDPTKTGTDATGSGSYQTNFGLAFQQLWNLTPNHFFRGRLALSYTLPSKVEVNGFNSFGGVFETTGQEKLGNQFGADIGMEYTLNEHWVPALDVIYNQNDASTFSGIVGTDANGLPAIENGSSGSSISFAPALEYNFSSKVGIIAGVWFTGFGQNAAKLTSGVIALNYYD